MSEIEIAPSLNVLGEPLAPCSTDPITGFFRNGCCDTCEQDAGSHTVCAIMTDEFLEFSRSVGNDLSTAHPQFGFAGLKAGDQWCLCAARFLQAWQAGKAPRIKLLSTHQHALQIVPLDVLRANAMERN